MIDAWDPREDGWLAGFTDGEGCFTLQRGVAGGQSGFYCPQFQIKLRADDLAVLEQLHQAFGGRLNYNGKRSYPWDSKPQWAWQLSAKRDLAVLVTYFDRFPLRAKKARDFAIWRRAVLIYCSRGGVDHSGQLAALSEALKAVRGFDATPDAADVDDPFEPQMALGID